MLLNSRRRRNQRLLGNEALESRQLLTSNILISEFVASNDSTLIDRDGDSPDWIELYNGSDVAVDLNGWHLTDRSDELDKWTLPTTMVDPGEFVVVFASGKNLSNPASELHTNFKLSSGGEFLALVEPDASTIAHKYDPFPQQFTDVSYGVSTASDLDTPRYFDPPTPGEANAEATEAPSGAVSYSITGRTFVEPFDLVITPETENAEIRYTLDGAIPDEESALYAAPIRVDESMRIRARAFDPDKTAGPVSSEGYIQLGSELTDFEGGVFGSNLPLMVFHSFGGRVHTNNSRLVPVSTVFINNDDGNAGLLDEPEFAGRAGLRIRGQSSQSWPKKQYALEIWEEGNSDTGPIRSNLADDRSVSIFGLPAESDWVLNGPYSDKTQLNNYLTFNWSRAMGQYAPRTRLVEVFVKTKSGALDYRTDYRGTYVLLEKIKIDAERVNITELSPAATEEPEISGGYIWKYDKNGTGDVNFNSSFQSRSGSGRPWKFVEPQRPPAAQRDWLKSHLTEFESVLYGNEFDDPVNGYAKYIDVDSWIDTWLLVEFTKNIDGFRLSTYYHKDLGGKIVQGPAWDFNLSLANANYLRGAFPQGWYHDDLSRPNYPYWDRLFEDPNFELRVRDRWFELRNTIFSTPNLLGDVDEAVNSLTNGNPNLGEIAPGEPSNPISRNFDRWGTLGSYLWPNCFFGIDDCPASPLPNRGRPDSYDDYIFITKDFIEERVAWIDRQFKLPPAITPADRFVGQPVEVTIAATSGGKAYYTLDGSDPRDAVTGTVADHAIEYEGAFNVAENVVVHARTLRGRSWSGIASQTYFVEIPSITISELNYNPADPSATERAAGFSDNDDFEFFELVNYGSKPVNLANMKVVEGIEVSLADAMVASGQRVVVVRNEDAFRFRYADDAQIVGEFGDRQNAALNSKLRNSGERIVLLGALGEPIVDLTYGDDWFPLTDGEGYSLVRREPIVAGLENDRNAWRPSDFTHGSPGSAESGTVPSTGDLVINEVVDKSSGALRDAVEIFNRTNRPLSIGGFLFTDDVTNLTKFRVPAGTQIAANGYLELDSEILGSEFQLDARGGSLRLRGALEDGTLTGFRDVVEYGASPSGHSWGRFEVSTGYDFALLSAATMGGPNALPVIGPVVINEIQYHPVEGRHEFIELRNISNETVPIGGWKFGRGIQFQFPAEVEIMAGAYLVLLQVEGSGGEGASDALVKTFRNNHDIPDEVKVLVYSDSDGSLDNGGETLILTRSVLGRDVEVDRISYSDQAPWISRADGFGPSLSRIDSQSYGNDPANWKTSTQTGTPGRDNILEDATPPSIPSNLAVAILANGDIALGWSPSIDADSHVNHYAVYRNGREIAASSIPFVRDSVTWSEDIAFSYHIVAVNIDGFASDRSNIVDVRVDSTSFQQGVDLYDGAADASIKEQDPDENDGDGRRLVIDGNGEGESGAAVSSLLRWSDISIPADSMIVGSAVAITVLNAGDDFDIKPVRRAWAEDEITWNQAADGRAWQVPGALGADDVASSVGVLKTTGRGFVSVSLDRRGTQAVEGWLENPETNHGLIIADTENGTDSVAFDSSQKRTIERRPRLTIFHTPESENVEGDFNLDGIADANDIDLIHAALREGVVDAIFDLDGNGLMNEGDVDFLLTNVLGTVRGDADLDGQVGFSDFLLLAASFASHEDQPWSRGDFDGDGKISFADFNLLAANFGKRIS